MYGVVCPASSRLLSRHKDIRKAKEMQESILPSPSVIVELVPVCGHRGMIGHTWPPVGMKISERHIRPWSNIFGIHANAHVGK